MTYIIHGASGTQGAPVVNALTEAGHQAIAANRAGTATTGPAVAVNMTSIESLVDAYTGADGVFVHLPLASPATQVEYATAIAEAVAKARPGRVVFSTSGYTGSRTVPGDELDAHSVLWRGLESSGVSFAVVAPLLFLDNLLVPVSLEPVRERGVLRYPIREDYPVSWSSHLDVADVAAQLLTETSVEGIVSVGAAPGLLGSDLAAGFAKHFGRDVAFESISPDEYGDEIAPIFGIDAIAPVVAAYKWRQTQQNEEINSDRSAQRLLGLEPRRIDVWLGDVLA